MHFVLCLLFQVRATWKGSLPVLFVNSRSDNYASGYSVEVVVNPSSPLLTTTTIVELESSGTLICFCLGFLLKVIRCGGFLVLD
jgi:hypothetical protein